MSSEWQTLIPETLHDAVREALAATYGATPIEWLGEVRGGASGAVAFRLAAGSQRHLLRVEARRGPMRNPHQYACMATAAEAGVAPPLHYADGENGVALIEMIDAVPLHDFPGGALARARALADLARSLQQTAPFPQLVDWRSLVGRLLDLLESRAAPGMLAPHREAYERLVAALAWDVGSHVSSHNDPNPGNVLFDGERLWLIDWETAFRNDPMVDVAIMAENLAPTSDLSGELLQGWLGHAPRADDSERFAAIRRLARLYYAGLLIGFGGPPDARLHDLSAPTPAEIEARRARGEMNEVTPENLLVAGKMCLAGFLVE